MMDAVALHHIQASSGVKDTQGSSFGCGLVAAEAGVGFIAAIVARLCNHPCTITTCTDRQPSLFFTQTFLLSVYMWI